MRYDPYTNMSCSEPTSAVVDGGQAPARPTTAALPPMPPAPAMTVMVPAGADAAATAGTTTVPTMNVPAVPETGATAGPTTLAVAPGPAVNAPVVPAAGATAGTAPPAVVPGPNDGNTNSGVIGVAAQAK